MKLIVVMLIIACLGLLHMGYQDRKRTNYWRESALANARKRHERDEGRMEEIENLNHKQADLLKRINNLEKINAVYKKQIEGDGDSRGVFERFHCLSRSVIWDSDFDLEDLGYEGKGIVHLCHCENCGAEIEYRISLDEE